VSRARRRPRSEHPRADPSAGGRLWWDHGNRVWLAALSRLVRRCQWAGRLSRDFGRAIIERGASPGAGGTSLGAFGDGGGRSGFAVTRGATGRWRRPPPSRSGRPASSRTALGRVLLPG
jgi:hypothetical protein